MLVSTASDIAHFATELKNESDRGLPLVAMALVDELLGETLRFVFCNEDSAKRLLDEGNSPLGSLSSRTEACRALGLINDFEHSEIGLLRKVRNEFAHARHGTTFANSRVQGLCSTLASPIEDDPAFPVQTARARFMNAALYIVLRLYHRRDWAQQDRREPRDWEAEELRFPPWLAALHTAARQRNSITEVWGAYSSVASQD